MRGAVSIALAFKQVYTSFLFITVYESLVEIILCFGLPIL